MYYIAVYDDTERLIGWIDADGKLTEDKANRSPYSSKETAQEFCYQLESTNPDWYPEVEE